MRHIGLAVVAGLLLLCGHAAAGVPNQFSVQGVLRDGTGKLQSMTVTVTVKLFDDKTAGNPIGAPFGPTPIIAVNGLFTEALSLDPTTTAAILKAPAVWLEITAGNDTFPRQLVTAQVFALMAGMADSLSANCSGCVTDAMIGGVAAAKVSGKVAAATMADSATTATNATSATTASNATQLGGVDAAGYQKKFLPVANCPAGQHVQGIDTTGAAVCAADTGTGGGGGTVTNVTGTAPITVTNGTTTPVVSLGTLSGANLASGGSHSHNLLLTTGPLNSATGPGKQVCSACPSGSVPVSVNCQVTDTGGGTPFLTQQGVAFGNGSGCCTVGGGTASATVNAQVICVGNNAGPFNEMGTTAPATLP